jgi:hypothetical protein
MDAATVGAPAVSLTAGAAHTKAASWTQLIAATEFVANGIFLMIGGNALTSHRNWFVDIGIGAGGAEVVHIPDLWVSHGAFADQYHHIYCPVEIPKGSRLSARCSCSTASEASLKISAHLFSANWLADGQTGPVKMYGGTVGSSSGTAITLGNAVESSWAQLTAATEHTHRQLLISVGKDYADTTITASSFVVDIGIGGSGAETELIADLQNITDANGDFVSPYVYGPLPVTVPKGSRLSARFKGDGAQTGMQIVAYGMG